MSATVATIGAGRGDRVDGAPHASDDVNTSEARQKVVANHSQLTQLAAQADSAITLPANAIVTSVVTDVRAAAGAAITLDVGFAGGAELVSAANLNAVAVSGGVLVPDHQMIGPGGEKVAGPPPPPRMKLPPKETEPNGSSPPGDQKDAQRRDAG